MNYLIILIKFKVSRFLCRSVYIQRVSEISALILTSNIGNTTNHYKMSEMSERRYCQYNNEGTDEIVILSLFPAFLCYCELLWQHFPPVLLKRQLY
jgi:glycyl-tRNA synthetase alpha subunit